MIFLYFSLFFFPPQNLLLSLEKIILSYLLQPTCNCGCCPQCVIREPGGIICLESAWLKVFFSLVDTQKPLETSETFFDPFAIIRDYHISHCLADFLS